MHTLIQTAKLSDIDAQAWRGRPARIGDHLVGRFDERLPWKWKPHAETSPLSQAA
jgi:hypothetical protein